MRPLHRAMMVFLFIPLLTASKCKKEPEPDPNDHGPDVVVPPEVELQVISIDPARGDAEQVFPAQIYGADFERGAKVMLSTFDAQQVDYIDENTLSIKVPALPTGSYDVIVANPGGERAVLRKGLTLAESADTRACSHLTLYFDLDKSELRSDAISVINANTACLSRSRGTIRIEGHCDERGTTEYNVALGQRRAFAVQRYLVSQGLPPSRVETVSYGEERPAVRGGGEEAWAQNRRAEVYVQN